MRIIDLLPGGSPYAIGTWVVDDLIVDPGPESTLPTLLAGLGDFVPRAIVLTHIHLDHAGASGRLVERWPDVEVWVHERGAPHLIDPSRLLSSAGRVYGDRLDALYGSMQPIPADRVRVVDDRESIGGLTAYATPGHARHHHAWLHAASGAVFTGDVAGVRIAPSGLVLAPCPPPEFDPEAWQQSIDRVASLSPSALALTHFGAFEDVDAHLDAAREAVAHAREAGRHMDQDAFTADVLARIDASCDAQTATAYKDSIQPAVLYGGVERYWAKRATNR